MYITPVFTPSFAGYLAFQLGKLRGTSAAQLRQILLHTIPESVGRNCFTDTEVLEHVLAALVIASETPPGPGDPLYSTMSALHDKMWGFKGKSFINVDLETADGRRRGAGCSLSNNRYETTLREGDCCVCNFQDAQVKFAEIVVRQDGTVELRVIPGTDGCTITDCKAELKSLRPLLTLCPITIVECVTSVTTRPLERP